MKMQKPAWLKSAGAFTMATGGPTREDTWHVSVLVEDMAAGDGSMLDFATWDKQGGGDVDSSDTTYRPGAMGPQISLGGPKTTSNVTASRLYRLERDHAHVGKLVAAVGRGRMTVIKQPLDIEGNAFGKPLVYNGRLKTVKFPTVDSEATGAAMIELEMSVEGDPAV